MHNDFKIGLIVGLVLVASAVVWLCTLPKLSTKSRALENASSRPAVNPVEQSAPAITPVTPITQPPVEIKPQPPEKIIRFHIVQKGDTLSGISQQYYGSPNKWQKIVAANPDTLPDPNRLTPGLKLIIPD